MSNERKVSPNWGEYFVADFEAGVLVWRRRPRKHFATDRAWRIWNTRFCGREAGSAHSMGYRIVGVHDEGRLVHRILWEMAHGPIPPGIQIDHIDRNKSNNSSSNLRLATNSQNQFNRGEQRNNTSGQKGVCWDKRSGKWQVAMQVNGVGVFIGYFSDFTLAVTAYRNAASIHCGQFAKP